VASIELREVCRSEGSTTILDRVSFEAAEGEFVGLIGPSGSGKTSIIRALAGFDQVASGEVLFDGKEVTSQSPRQRNVGLITQETALFPTHRVGQNVAFPLLARALRRGEVAKRVKAESQALSIDHILDRWPDGLSAGEQKLTQIARAMVTVPQVFLMDEPLANLDPPTKRKLREELAELQRGYGVTTVYVATRTAEIQSMPDKIVALDHGRVAQIGAPSEITDRPATRSIAELTGPIGWLSCSVARDEPGFAIAGSGFKLRGWAPALADVVGAELTLGVRPADVHPTTTGGVEVVATGTTYDGPTVLRELTCGGGTLVAEVPGISTGDRLRVTIARWHLFRSNGELAITQG